ncbi:hypothetical protein MOF07_19410 [Bacillus spizizenii]|nr:hypothetical protein [Bacillus spizizenii]
MTETKKYVRIKKATVARVWYADKIGQIFEVVHENSVALLTKCHGCHAVLREDAEVIVTEKRKAAVGERVLITNPYPLGKQTYKAGDVFEVAIVNDPVTGCVKVSGLPSFIDYKEYEVIVNSEVENEEANEMKNGKTRYDLAVENAREAIEELRLAAYEQGYEDARRQLNAKDPAVSAQARRDEIVEQAKADVEGLKSGYFYEVKFGADQQDNLHCYSESIINTEKRTVVVLLRDVVVDKVRRRGIAKAAPSDCFNVHIGKAIALRRALGLAVPDEYLNAPQPTEVRVGDVIKYEESGRIARVVSMESDAYLQAETYLTTVEAYPNRIIDDSREEVGE